MRTSIEVAAVILHSCVAVSSISFNLLLLVVVCRHTPKSLSTFAITIKFHALADFSVTLGGSATMIRLIPIDWAVAAFFYGPCGHFGLKACHMAFALMLGGIEIALCSVLASLIFRLMVIHGKMPTARQACRLICFISLPMPTVVIVAYCNLSYDTSAIRDLMNKVHPEYDANSHVVEGHIDIRSDSLVIIVVLLVVVFWLLYTLMLIIRSRILNAIDQCAFKISDKSKQLQRKLVAMLTTQAALPLIPSIAIISYFLGFFNIIHHPVIEFMAFLLVDTTSILSPSVALSYIDHYRKAALSIFCLNRSTEDS